VNKQYLILFIFFLPNCFCMADSKEQMFYDAVRTEASGDLQQALNIYSNISSHMHSAPLHANIANLYYKLSDYPLSALHFRKALLLNPQNREYRSALSLALDKCGIPSDQRTDTNLFFSIEFYPYSHFLLSALTWGGIITFIWFFRFPLKGKFFYLIISAWVTLVILLYLYYDQCNDLLSTLKHEGIAYHPSDLEGNQTNEVSLRVFAGNGSTSNTVVPAGTSLFLDLGSDDKPRVHSSPSGEKWFLVRSFSGANKGWVREDEFMKIIN
jgi:tetratricopeptide (TPR) repeat protein